MTSEQTANRIDDICQRLEHLAADLTDLSIETIREAVEQGETKRPPQDKKILQARRAVDKALRTLQPQQSELD